MSLLKAIDHLMKFYPILLQIIFLDLFQSYLGSLFSFYFLVLGLFLYEKFNKFLKPTDKALVNFYIVVRIHFCSRFLRIFNLISDFFLLILLFLLKLDKSRL